MISIDGNITKLGSTNKFELTKYIESYLFSILHDL